MSEELEEIEADGVESADAEGEQVAAAPRKRISAPKLLGKMVGASIAIPTAAVVFCVAALAGVPVSTAVSRSLITALVMWVFVGLAIRFLFSFVIHDWRQRLHSGFGKSELIDE